MEKPEPEEASSKRLSNSRKQRFVLRRIKELKHLNKAFSMRSETEDGLSSCSNFPEPLP